MGYHCEAFREVLAGGLRERDLHDHRGGHVAEQLNLVWWPCSRATMLQPSPARH
jgi:hypothetical protein